MYTRLISAALFASLYLVFLAWYGGWGNSPISEGELREWQAHSLSQGEFSTEAGNIARLLAADDGEEFYMLNLNRYAYAAGTPQEGVPADYQAYGRAVLPLLLQRASHPIYSGQLPAFLVTGELDHPVWHEVILVRYRSRRDFVDMITSDAYRSIVQNRSGGIAFAAVAPTQAGLNLITPRYVVFTVLLLLGLGVDRALRARN